MTDTIRIDGKPMIVTGAFQPEPRGPVYVDVRRPLPAPAPDWTELLERAQRIEADGERGAALDGWEAAS